MKLHSFKIRNFRSFFGEENIVFNHDNKNANAIFGPNGSGKSNLFFSMNFYRNFILNSTKYETQNMPNDKFLLNTNSNKTPSSFCAIFTTNKYTYDYGFSILDSDVVDEYLKRSSDGPRSKFETIFRRASVNKNRFEKYGFTSLLLRKTRPNALLLTKAWEDNNKIATDVFEWLNHFKLLAGNQKPNLTAQKIIENDYYKKKVLDLLRKADLYIQDISAYQTKIPQEVLDSLPLIKGVKATIDRTSYDVLTSHLIYDSRGRVTGTKQLSMARHESKGSKRIFELAYPLIDTLDNGNILFIDEFETFLHPKECSFIIDLFSDDNNPNQAQLIVNTHNTQIINQLGRNNIHLLGKNSKEETVIGTIPKDVRPDDVALEKKYNKGLFGAIPNIKS